MKKFSCILVDDESFNIRLYSDYIGRCDQLMLLKTFSDPTDALFFLKDNNEVDILFTDVDMPELSGVALAESAQNLVQHIVFITSHSERDLAPKIQKKWHYLAKPASFENFSKTFQMIQAIPT